MKNKNDWAAVSEVIFEATIIDGSELCPPLQKWPWEKPKKWWLSEVEGLAFMNPKPLPPVRMSLVLGMLINELEACNEVARFLPASQSQEAIQETSSFMLKLMDDCGNDKYEQLIAKILKKIKKGPFPPDPGPQPDWLKEKMNPNELIIFGAALGQFAKQNFGGDFEKITAKGQDMVEMGFNNRMG